MCNHCRQKTGYLSRNKYIENIYLQIAEKSLVISIDPIEPNLFQRNISLSKDIKYDENLYYTFE